MTKPLELMPDDVPSLKGLVAAQREQIEHLKLQIAKLQRAQFGRRAESLSVSPDQLTLIQEPLPSKTLTPVSGKPEVPPKPRPYNRKPLPEHLPREIQIHGLDSTQCPDCGGPLKACGETVSERLEIIPARFKVIRQVRPKFACRGCATIHQAPAADAPIVRGKAGRGLIGSGAGLEVL